MDAPFRVTHQRVALDIDMQATRVAGMTEMTLAPLDESLDRFSFNARNLDITRITVDGVVAEYAFQDALQRVVPQYEGQAAWSVGRYDECLATAMASADAGELLVYLPKEVKLVPRAVPLGDEAAKGWVAPPPADEDSSDDEEDNSVASRLGMSTSKIKRATREKAAAGGSEEEAAAKAKKKKKKGLSEAAAAGAAAALASRQQRMKASYFEPVVVRIEYSVTAPAGGLRFVLPDADAFPMRAPQLHTTGEPLSTRMWLPCVDNRISRPLYEFAFTVDARFMVVASGTLVSQVETGDGATKTFYYMLEVPTAAGALSLAVAPFEVVQDPRLPFVTTFCLPGEAERAVHTAAALYDIFEFYEDYLGLPYPHENFKLAFLEELPGTLVVGATVAFCSDALLHDACVADQVQPAACELALAVATQWFGAFIDVPTWSEVWTLEGLARLLRHEFVRAAFGIAAAKLALYSSMQVVRVVEGGNALAGVVMPPLSHPTFESHPAALMEDFGAVNALPVVAGLSLVSHALSYGSVFGVKAFVVMHMLQTRAGPEKFKRLLVGTCRRALDSDLATILDFEGEIFARLCKKDSSLREFAEMWVSRAGSPTLLCGFWFNRKQHMAEVAIRQEGVRDWNSDKFTGPLILRIHEYDGLYDHVLHIDDVYNVCSAPVNSKNRKARAKTVKLENGEYASVDVTAMNDAPILWLRPDPDLMFLGTITFVQSEDNWVFQATLERDVVGQLTAIAELGKIGTPDAIKALAAILEDTRNYHAVRSAAAAGLATAATVRNAGAALETLISLFKSFYFYEDGSRFKPNDYSDLAAYHVLVGMVRALAIVRDASGESPQHIRDFLGELLKTNDNSSNELTDAFFVAELYKALTQTALASRDSAIGLAMYRKLCSALDFYRILPSYHDVVSQAALAGIAALAGAPGSRVPRGEVLDKLYEAAAYGKFADVRVVAYCGLVDLVALDSVAALTSFLGLLAAEPVTTTAYVVLKHVAAHVGRAPMYKELHSPVTELVAARKLTSVVWHQLNVVSAYDSKRAAGWRAVYRALFGYGKPVCLPNEVPAAQAERPRLKLVIKQQDVAAAMPQAMDVADEPSTAVAMQEAGTKVAVKTEEAAAPVPAAVASSGAVAATGMPAAAAAAPAAAVAAGAGEAASGGGSAPPAGEVKPSRPVIKLKLGGALLTSGGGGSDDDDEWGTFSSSEE
ncbi:transcription initiation factor TFIID subunit 2 [Thecamonas trahens ATCC 50062]|uniref:Transcription initiation factor TFIID subunit 2 n=1 Tax=Thecamonas trahens ATCC 50062 TaxID=461836 RepID=A0A0L0DN29_THETB|nr:transcription initiation factor TFIID subunit 2 [Thecamonas trahens ATCC 50062]KNC53714.1 transcription initiation factor TFIID subunit 2 [Thecamonas trahens ATCC 50062]|eukprot:XP_013762028.1 transcription initiation factor TFIID subunit 2 [Thecamonas trahens ATCC 50062]